VSERRESRQSGELPGELRSEEERSPLLPEPEAQKKEPEQSERLRGEKLLGSS
jgi:hypothetical protein